MQPDNANPSHKKIKIIYVSKRIIKIIVEMNLILFEQWNICIDCWEVIVTSDWMSGSLSLWTGSYKCWLNSFCDGRAWNLFIISHNWGWKLDCSEKVGAFCHDDPWRRKNLDLISYKSLSILLSS